MKILVLSNLYPPDVLGGYELGCRQAVDALLARGHEVRVLTSAPRRPVASAPHVLRNLRLTEIWSPYLFTHSAAVTNHLAQAEALRINAANCHALIREIEEFQPDVAYLWMIVGLGGLGLMGCLEHMNVPWVWHLMDCVPLSLCQAAHKINPVFAHQFERLLAKGTILSCSRQLINEIEIGGVHLGENVELVPNWVEGSLPPPRERYLTDGRLRIVTAAAQIVRGLDKGIDLLIEVAAALRERGYENFEVDIYGNISDPYFDGLIRSHDLEQHVRLRGPREQSDLIALLSDYDLFAFPTRSREPFGFVALEAAAQGCVPVMSQACGIAEWLVDGVHAIKAPRTIEGFTDTFARVMDGVVDLAAIGRRGAAVVRRDFHLDAIIPRIERSLVNAAALRGTDPAAASEAYHLALLAERLTRVLVQESQAA